VDDVRVSRGLSGISSPYDDGRVMSYLNVPRFHFAGNFQADPSTVNNNDNNLDPKTTLSNNRSDPGWLYWNPNGTHNWLAMIALDLSDARTHGRACESDAPHVDGAERI
jgi:hypothetical protein